MQPNSGGHKLLFFSREKCRHDGDNNKQDLVHATQEWKAERRRLSLTQAHTHIKKNEMERSRKRRNKDKHIEPVAKAALSAVVFILGSLLSVRLYE